jgi:hypothetical protein
VWFAAFQPQLAVSSTTTIAYVKAMLIFGGLAFRGAAGIIATFSDLCFVRNALQEPDHWPARIPAIDM